MISISHAYILKKIWEIKTNNKSYLKYLSKSWTSYLFLKTNFKIFLHEEGIVGYINLVKFKEKNWQLWLKHLNRYNLSPQVWNEITPEQWRFKVSEHWKINRKLVFTKNKNKNFITCWENYIFKTNNSSSIIKKRNKLFKTNFLVYNYFDLNKSRLTKKVLKSKEQQNLNSNLIFIISNKKKKLDFSIIEKNIFLEYNLWLWFIPEFIKQRDIYTEKIFNRDTSIQLKNTILQNKDLFQETEFNQSIRQWRWKSKNYEKQFKKLGEMASLMTFMQNQDTKISLSKKMREDLDLFRLFFRRNNIVNQLTINSEHRLPRILDDQVLIYKLINTSSSFRKRFEKILNLVPFNKYQYLLKPNIYTNYRLRNLSLFNTLSLEDVLLPKNRREFRILNSLYFQTQKENINSTKNFLNKIRKQSNKKIKLNKRTKIKRFIWSSYRFEDLACMNRFWFSILNASRFSMLRVRIYPII